MGTIEGYKVIITALITTFFVLSLIYFFYLIETQDKKGKKKEIKQKEKRDKYELKREREEYKLNKHCNLHFDSYGEIWLFCEENNIDKKRIGQKQIIVKHRGQYSLKEKKNVFYIRNERFKKEVK